METFSIIMAFVSLLVSVAAALIAWIALRIQKSDSDSAKFSLEVSWDPDYFGVYQTDQSEVFDGIVTSHYKWLRITNKSSATISIHKIGLSSGKGDPSLFATQHASKADDVLLPSYSIGLVKVPVSLSGYESVEGYFPFWGTSHPLDEGIAYLTLYTSRGCIRDIHCRIDYTEKDL